MIINVSIDVAENATPQEIGYALVQAAQIADFRIMRNGVPKVDEEHDLQLHTKVVEIRSASMFRSE